MNDLAYNDRVDAHKIPDHVMPLIEELAGYKKNYAKYKAFFVFSNISKNMYKQKHCIKRSKLFDNLHLFDKFVNRPFHKEQATLCLEARAWQTSQRRHQYNIYNVADPRGTLYAHQAAISTNYKNAAFIFKMAPFTWEELRGVSDLIKNMEPELYTSQIKTGATKETTNQKMLNM